MIKKKTRLSQILHLFLFFGSNVCAPYFCFKFVISIFNLWKMTKNFNFKSWRFQQVNRSLALSSVVSIFWDVPLCVVKTTPVKNGSLIKADWIVKMFLHCHLEVCAWIAITWNFIVHGFNELSFVLFCTNSAMLFIKLAASSSASGLLSRPVFWRISHCFSRTFYVTEVWRVCDTQ